MGPFTLWFDLLEGFQGLICVHYSLIQGQTEALKMRHITSVIPRGDVDVEYGLKAALPIGISDDDAEEMCGTVQLLMWFFL